MGLLRFKRFSELRIVLNGKDGADRAIFIWRCWACRDGNLFMKIPSLPLVGDKLNRTI